jgi:hypothetical protein
MGHSLVMSGRWHRVEWRGSSQVLTGGGCICRVVSPLLCVSLWVWQSQSQTGKGSDEERA